MLNMRLAAVSCLISLIILAVFSQYLGASIPFLAIAVYFLQRFYLQTSRQMRLLSIEARAPLYTHFTESIAGAVTIRAFGWQSQYEERCSYHIDFAQTPAYLQSCIQHWLNFVLDVMVTVLAVALVGTVVTWHDKFSSGSVGVGLIMVTGFNEILARLIQNWTKMESSVGAAARIMRFVAETEREDTKAHGVDPPPGWPQAGAVDFINVVACYQGQVSVHIDSQSDRMMTNEVTDLPTSQYSGIFLSGSARASTLPSAEELEAARRHWLWLSCG